jgi:hypothetical protein
MPRAASSAGFDYYLQPFTMPEPEYYGSVMLFYQATAPLGWTQITTENDIGLRIVSGTTGGTVSGTRPFTTVYPASPTTTVSVVTSPLPGATSNPTTISINQMGIHTHSPNVTANTAGGNQTIWGPTISGGITALAHGFSWSRSSGNVTLNPQPAGYTGGGHNHTWAGAAGGGSFTAITPTGFAIKYMNFIQASKNS